MTAVAAAPHPPTDALVRHSTRIVLRPIANPLPLGFIALATGTLLLSGLQLGWLKPTEGHLVATILLAFVAPLQLIASIFGFLARDAVAGTGMGILAGTWLSIALVTRDLPSAGTSDALGLMLLISAASMLIPAAAATLGKLLATAVLTTTAIRFAATGVYQLTAGAAWKEAAGLIGVVLAGLALYTAAAMLLEDVQRSTTLPTWRRGRGQASLEGNLADQLSRLEHEAGVREQL